MKNKMLSNHQNKQSDDLYYPSLKLYEPNINVLTMDKPIISKKELEQLYLEGQEYDFLKGKSPTVFSDFWEED